MSKIEELTKEYMRLAHKMQCGVAIMMNYDTGDTTPKSLRVGVNAAMTDLGSLATLLIAKGVFTHEEYLQALVDGMKKEADSYQKLVNDTVAERSGNKGVNIELV